jgi:pimeloyl-ACP methyl ester carboxylesterase
MTPLPTDGPRWLYLHGFASGPQSAKGVALSNHYAARGITLTRLNLRVPSVQRLQLSAMIGVARDAIGGARDRAVVFGSSLGGLTAALAAQEDPRVCALVLLAPAFGLVERWRRRMGEAEWHKWETSGWLEIDDFAEQGRTQLSFDYMRDAIDVEARLGVWPDVRVPTLVVHGRRDETVPIEGSRVWAAGKRHVRLVEVDDGHELVPSLARICAEADEQLRPWLGAVDGGASAPGA